MGITRRHQLQGGSVSDGARVEIRDPRVTSFVAWGGGLLGLAVIGIGTWVASSINELTVTVAKASEKMEFIVRQQTATDVRVDAHDSRLNAVERSVAVMEGRNYRGGQFTPQEQRRGN